MTNKEEIIHYMNNEYKTNQILYNDYFDLIVQAASMFELWEQNDDYPDWIESVAKDICEGNY